MEDTGKKSRPRQRRSFTSEFKAEIFDLCQRGDRSLGQVAREFDLTETAVPEWVKQAQRNTGQRADGLTTAERAELAVLRRENRRLQQDVDILKRGPRLSSRRRPNEALPVHRAEKVSERNVARAWVLLKVSRSAYYTHRAGPSARRVADVELARAIAAVHTESKSRCGAPRVHAVLARQGRRHGRNESPA